MKRFLFFFLIFLWTVVLTISSVGESWMINGGGVIEGKLLESNQRLLQIEVKPGIVLTIDPKWIQDKSGEGREVLRMYESFAPLESDTVENHLNIANWCTEHYLNDLAKVHLNRVLDLDPDNVDARRKLGYTKDKGTGEWSTSEERMESRGYVYDKGRWKLPQEVWIEDRTEERTRAISKWKQQFRKVRSNPLAEPNRQFFLSITDSTAVGPITELLKEEKNPDARILYVQVLSNIGGSSAIEVLTKTALNDFVPEVRRAALEQIVKHPASIPLAGSYFSKVLADRNSDGTSRTDSQGIQRAAFAIAEIGDVNSIGPLIRSLITRHKEVQVQGSSGIGGSATSGGGGGLGFSMGQSKQEYVREVQNEMVLFALKKLTGMNFQYNQDGWENWYREQQKPVPFSVRRDM
ncbi:MAG: hypothetical protein ACRC10_10075 [Thermoguttaceae bacterium]